jgi:hypothetical protein
MIQHNHSTNSTTLEHNQGTRPTQEADVSLVVMCARTTLEHNQGTRPTQEADVSVVVMCAREKRKVFHSCHVMETNETSKISKRTQRLTCPGPAYALYIPYALNLMACLPIAME